MSFAARLMAGATLVTVPAIVYGGLVVLGVVTGGTAGLNPGHALTPVQVSLYRAGHAHAGVLVILSLVAQVLLDHARLAPGLGWTVRVAAPLAAVVVSGGFFAVAHAPQLRIILYAGAALVAFAAFSTGVGLLLSLRGAASGSEQGGRVAAGPSAR
jgi:hypothetical protein